MTADKGQTTESAVLTFRLGEQDYGLLIADVVEVASMIELVTIADARPELLGIANRHGNALPILDLRRIMGNQEPMLNTATFFIVAASGDQIAGLVVDEIYQVEYIPIEYLKKSTASTQYIRGIISYEQRLIQIVSLAPLLETYLSDKILDDAWIEV
jgi:purine-binding chemotaxis protein CheW